LADNFNSWQEACIIPNQSLIISSSVLLLNG
jgi:hypothetical protein